MNPVPIEQPVSDITPEMADTDAALRRALHEAVDAICNVDMEFVTRDLTATLARCGMFSQVAHVAHLAAQRNALFDAFINERDKAHMAKVEAERAAYSEFIAKGNAADLDYFSPEELEGR